MTTSMTVAESTIASAAKKQSNVVRERGDANDSENNSVVGFFFFSSRRRHTRWTGDWSSDVCSSDLIASLQDRLWVGVAGRQLGHHASFAQDDDAVGDARQLLEVRERHDAAGAGGGELQIGRASCRERGWMAVVGGSW